MIVQIVSFNLFFVVSSLTFTLSLKRHRSRSDAARLLDRRISSAMKSISTISCWKASRNSRRSRKTPSIRSMKLRLVSCRISMVRMIFSLWRTWTITTITRHRDRSRWISTFAGSSCKPSGGSTRFRSSFAIKVRNCLKNFLRLLRRLTTRKDFGHGTTISSRLKLKSRSMLSRKFTAEQSSRNALKSSWPKGRFTTRWSRWRTRVTATRS